MSSMDADDLYGLPFDRFVPERGALAKALRAEGRRDEATEVAGLRKPSVAAWAVNQVMRTQGKTVAKLWAAGDGLRKAHEDALAGGGDGSSLRAAAERERTVIEALVGAARGLLTSQGHELSATVLERVGETLRAAARDEQAREAVRAGRLERELRQLGFGVSVDAAEAPAGRRTAKPKPKSAPPKKASGAKDRDREAAERAELQRLERERDAARKAAQVAERKARRLVDRAARAVEVAEERRERAAQALSEADEVLATAREEAEAVAEAHRSTRDELDSS